MLPVMDEARMCPSCGGGGGGPIGRAGSAWDDESYVCPRCAGSGRVTDAGPGVAKASTGTPASQRRASGDEH
jgi:hypothetical protein